MMEGIGIRADANSIAQQALANIRTVYSFNGEERTSQAYSDSLQDPLRVGARLCAEPVRLLGPCVREEHGHGVFAC